MKRILEWVAISFSRRSSQPRDWTRVSCIGRQILYHQATREALPCVYKHIHCWSLRTSLQSGYHNHCHFLQIQNLRQGLRDMAKFPTQVSCSRGHVPNHPNISQQSVTDQNVPGHPSPCVIPVATLQRKYCYVYFYRWAHQGLSGW